jgi:Family of unknown function (DUF6186)
MGAGAAVITRVITAIGFAGLIMAMFGLEFAARRGSQQIPTLGQWLGYLMRSRAGRGLVLLGWWWLGWHYFAR